jgi:hypothetical protein
MRTKRTFKLHQFDQACTDSPIIEDRLAAIYARLTRTPTRVELARTALIGMIGGAELMRIGIGLFWLHGCDAPMFLLIIIRLLIWLLLSLCFRMLLIVLTATEMWRWHRRERSWSVPATVETRR